MAGLPGVRAGCVGDVCGLFLCEALGIWISGSPGTNYQKTAVFLCSSYLQNTFEIITKIKVLIVKFGS